MSTGRRAGVYFYRIYNPREETMNVRTVCDGILKNDFYQ